jgi:hypothetical protein
VIGGVLYLVVSQSLDLVSIGVFVIRRSASFRFLSVATLFLAQALDFATFSIMVGRVGPHAEANPLVSGTFGALGLPALAALKLLVVVLVGALTVAATTRGRQGGLWSMVGGLPLALAIAAGLIGGITNTAAILR